MGGIRGIGGTAERWRAFGARDAAGVIAVVAVAAIVAAGAALAWQHGNPGAPTGTPAPVPTFTLGLHAPTAEEGEPEPTASAAPAAVRFPGRHERFLSVDSEAMWRATAGSCGRFAPKLERSRDGGASWTDVTPTYRGVGEIVALDAFGGTHADIIGLGGDDCAAEGWRTYSDGEFWDATGQVFGTSRYLVPPAAGSEGSDGDGSDADASGNATIGDVEAPCAKPWSLRSAGNVLALVCEGAGWVYADGAWTELPVDDVVGIALDRRAALVASRAGDVGGGASADEASGDAGECAGVAVIRFEEPGAEGEVLGCAETDAGIDAPVALDAGTSSGAHVWVGGELIRVP